MNDAKGDSCAKIEAVGWLEMVEIGNLPVEHLHVDVRVEAHAVVEGVMGSEEVALADEDVGHGKDINMGIEGEGRGGA